MADKEYEKIAVLIAREVSDEISEEELQVLLEWRRRAATNNSLYLKIRNSQNFKSWLAERKDVEIEEGWSKVHTEIRKRSRKFFLLKISKIAAVFFLFVLVGSAGYFYFNGQVAKRKTGQQYAQIKPGTSKATLILYDGRNVLLDPSNMMLFTEVDGTAIEKRQGEISYAKSERQKKGKPVYNTISVPVGGEYRLILADGTKVYLNSMTTLRYPVQFNSEKREVELTGEAYFVVAKNEAVPFIVNTKKLKVEVLGTSFNVNAYDDSKNIITTLVEGKVKLAHNLNKGDAQILNPNEQAVVDILTGKIALHHVDVNNYISWKDGQLVFYDMPLQDIMVLLARWYSVKVFYQNPAVKNIRFSGSLDKYDEIGKFIDIIETTQKVEVKIKDDTILFAEK